VLFYFVRFYKNMFSKILLFLALVSSVFSQFYCDPYQGCVNFKELSALTFINGQKTTDFKGNTYPKIECTGNIEDCNKIISVQCHNKGVSDSGNNNWKCDYQFLHNSHIKVIEDYPSCAGYRFPGDPDYILKGSCIMKVTVTNTYQHDQNINLNNDRTIERSGDFLFTIVLLIFFIILLVFMVSFSNNTTTHTRTHYEDYYRPRPTYGYNPTYGYSRPYLSEGQINSTRKSVPGKTQQKTHCESKNR
jgi:hypothetical protein